MTSEGSFLSRFAVKFLEIFAAGLATAVSGYLIAHFSGYFAVLTPTAAVQPPPVIQQAVPSESATPVVNETPPAAAAPQSNTTGQPPSSNLTGAKGRDNARDTARGTTETKLRDPARSPAVQSFEARMRAAIDKAEPVNPASSDAPRRQAAAPVDAMPRLSNAPTRPVDTPTGSIAGAPPPPDDTASRAAPVELLPGPAAPAVENTAAPSPAIQLAPPAAVEIKSQPIASVDANQPAPAAAQPPGTDQDGPFAAITKSLHIDKLLTGDQPARPPDQPPRPPLPVGQ